MIWRIHLKITIRFTLVGAAGTTDAVMVAIYVDNFSAAPNAEPNVLLNPYNQKFLMWDNLYAAQQEFEGGPVTTADRFLYHEYDIKSHRKLPNQESTLWLYYAPNGTNLTAAEVSYTQSTLLRVP